MVQFKPFGYMTYREYPEIKKEIKSYGMTIKNFAFMIGMSPPQLIQKLGGFQRLHMEEYDKIKNTLNDMKKLFEEKK